MIAMALACDPRLLIADEPTTALDVTIQAQILDLMRELKAASGAAIILITHDLGVVAEVCDEVAVMYAGEIVERAPVDELFATPQHPYTVGLLGSIPRLDRRAAQLADHRGHGAEHGRTRRPAAVSPPRCPFVIEACTAAPPPLVEVGPAHCVALHPHAAAGAGVMSAPCSKSKAWKNISSPRARCSGGRRAISRRSTASALWSRPARRWRWSANPVAASPPSSRLVLRLIEPDAGSVRFEGRDLLALDANELRAFRRRCAAHLPGPLRLAQSAHDGRARS